MLRFCFAALIAPMLLSASIRPVELRCEYRRNPLGIDVLRPRLSWQLAALSPQARDLKQTAYQILIATTPEKLQAGQGDLWDTGKVPSADSILIEYNGAPLSSGRPAFWKVQVWDQDGKPSEWSEAAHWSMGLLMPADWRASWIGREEPGLPKDPDSPFWSLTKAKWIEAPAFHKSFPISSPVREATLVMAGDPRFEVSINGERLGVGMSVDMPQVFDARPYLKTGDNVIDVKGPAKLIAALTVIPDSGSPLTFESDRTWGSVQELGPYGMPPYGEVGFKEERALPARYLRREFDLTKPLRRATVYVSGLGLYELNLNGKKVGDAVLAPSLTEYDKRVFYNTFDVTSSLAQGKNTLDVILGNGRWWAPRMKVPTFTRTFGAPQVILQLELEYADGSTARVATDGHWRISDGPIRANNEYDGELYDARREAGPWNWQPVHTMIAPQGSLVAQMSEPLRVIETLKAVKLSQPKPGVFVYDLGQNMVGWCRLHARGPAGTRVSLRFAETVGPNGMLFLDNLRSARANDVYILKGNGDETWEPRFTYHGFRYVELTGFPGTPSLASIEGRVVHDDMEKGAAFESSSALLNSIHHNIYWGVKGNYRSIPTDCPQRDERQGWLGDRSVVSRGESYLHNIAAFYTKWVQDIADAQRINGSVPDVVPSYWPFYNDGITWPSTFVLVPGMLYDQYGDRRILERHYPALRKWIEYMHGYEKDGLMPRDTYGDWCVPPERPELIHSEDPARRTDGTLIGTAYFYRMLLQMERYARILDRKDDAAEYAAWAARMRAAYQHKFFDSSRGVYGNGTQTSSILSLAFDLSTPDQRTGLKEKLLRRIDVESAGHVGTGLVGAQWLMRALTDIGSVDEALKIATQPGYPGWGYMVGKGATTVWELWNGDTADPAMNSGNHVMQIGDLAVWMYERLAGIRPDPDRPGFRHILIEPVAPSGLQFVKASHRSPLGLISTNWKRNGGNLELEVTIPPNTTATVKWGAETREVGSGTWSFVAKQ